MNFGMFMPKDLTGAITIICFIFYLSLMLGLRDGIIDYKERKVLELEAEDPVVLDISFLITWCIIAPVLAAAVCGLRVLLYWVTGF